jgi:Fe2+ or Zn2+ uptake regulation protein
MRSGDRGGQHISSWSRQLHGRSIVVAINHWGGPKRCYGNEGRHQSIFVCKCNQCLEIVHTTSELTYHWVGLSQILTENAIERSRQTCLHENSLSLSLAGGRQWNQCRENKLWEFTFRSTHLTRYTNYISHNKLLKSGKSFLLTLYNALSLSEEHNLAHLKLNRSYMNLCIHN